MHWTRFAPELSATSKTVRILHHGWPTPPRNFLMRRITMKRLSREMGRCSWISTRSPTLNFVLLVVRLEAARVRTYFSVERGTRRAFVTSTVTVLFILCGQPCRSSCGDSCERARPLFGRGGRLVGLNSIGHLVDLTLCSLRRPAPVLTALVFVGDFVLALTSC